MKNRVKCNLMDEILMGNDIRVVLISDYSCALYIDGTVPHRELFRWKGSAPFVTNPVTLKDALGLIDMHWENRVDHEER